LANSRGSRLLDAGSQFYAAGRVHSGKSKATVCGLSVTAVF